MGTLKTMEVILAKLVGISLGVKELELKYKGHMLIQYNIYSG